MVGSIIGAGVKVLGSVVGGVAGARAAAKEKAELAKKEAENQRYYEVDMAKDYTNRVDSQNAINKMRDVFLERQRNASASNVVSGGSAESEALLKEQSANAMAETIGNIAEQSDVRKDSVEQRYRENRDAILDARIANEKERKANIANAVGGVLTAGADIGAGISGLKKEKKFSSNSGVSGNSGNMFNLGNDSSKSVWERAADMHSGMKSTMDKYNKVFTPSSDSNVFGLNRRK